MSAGETLVTLGRLGGGLIVVLMLMFISTKVARRARGHTGSSGLSVVDRIVLSREAHLAVVDAGGGRRLLLGVTSQGVSMLTSLDGADATLDDVTAAMALAGMDHAGMGFATRPLVSLGQQPEPLTASFTRSVTDLMTEPPTAQGGRSPAAPVQDDEQDDEQDGAQLVIEPEDEPIHGLVDELVMEAVDELVHEPVDQPVRDLVAEPVEEPVHEPVREPLGPATSEPVSALPIARDTDEIAAAMAELVNQLSQPGLSLTPAVAADTQVADAQVGDAQVGETSVTHASTVPPQRRPRRSARPVAVAEESVPAQPMTRRERRARDAGQARSASTPGPVSTPSTATITVTVTDEISTAAAKLAPVAGAVQPAAPSPAGDWDPAAAEVAAPAPDATTPDATSPETPDTAAPDIAEPGATPDEAITAGATADDAPAAAVDDAPAAAGDDAPAAATAVTAKPRVERVLVTPTFEPASFEAVSRTAVAAAAVPVAAAASPAVALVTGAAKAPVRRVTAPAGLDLSAHPDLASALRAAGRTVGTTGLGPALPDAGAAASSAPSEVDATQATTEATGGRGKSARGPLRLPQQGQQASGSVLSPATWKQGIDALRELTVRRG